MNEILTFLADLVPAIMTIVALLIVITEWIVLGRQKIIKLHKEGKVNVWSAVLTYIPIFIINQFLTITIMFWVYQYRIFDLRYDWYVWILCYIGYDFMSYATHWLSHKVRFFWCIHSVHHAPKEMKASVAFRGSFAEFLIAPHITLWLPLLGFHPLLIIIVEGVGQLYGVPLHFNEHVTKKTNQSWLKRYFITPAIHRLHHASNAIYIDTNYGLTFNIWDRLFNTFQKEVKTEKPIYGLNKEIDSENLWVSQTDEFFALWQDIKRAPKWSDKIKYCLYPPGWSHAHAGVTAKTIRLEALRKIKSN